MFVNGKSIDNIRIKTFLFGSDDYEFYKTLSNDNLIIVTFSLHSKWLKDNLLTNVDPFIPINISGIEYFYLKSNKDFQLTIIENNGITQSRQSALNFVFALKQTRKYTDISLYKSIYIEEFGCLLPTYVEKNISDDALLGGYFSGDNSKHFSDGNFKSLFLTEKDFDDISKLAEIKINKQSEKIEVKKEIKYDKKFTLTGRPELEKFFNEHIVNILNEPERYKKLGIDFPSSIILYGPPGCGKTYAVDRLVEFLKLPKFEINASSVASPYIHDTSRKISSVFENAIHNAPSIVVIDEMESYLSDRNSFGEGTHHMEEVAEFLRQIQEANQHHVIVIAMTNMLNKIDPAILRKWRFDHHIEVGYPSKDEIESLLNSLLSKVAVSKDVIIKDIALKLEGKSLADVSFVVKEAALISGKVGLDEITNNSILEAIEMLPQKQVKRKIGFGD